MKISFVTTVLNEEATIERLLSSLLKQTKLPDEVIIVDGGSRDKTISNSKFLISNFKKKNTTFKLIIKKGNRAVGRNEAIRVAHGEVILVSDAGCILDKKWVGSMVEKFKDKKVDVVAGNYEGKSETIFQKCLVPYVLVMPDRVDPNFFLPASRSMAFRKNVWKKVGGFPGKYSHNEDYVFAHLLKKAGAKIVFQKNAIVYWLPRKTFREAFHMFYRFAYGDAEAGIFRGKVILLSARYIIGVILFVISIIFKLYLLLNTLYFILFLYLIWAMVKNYTYVKDWRAIIYLPLLQLTSDTAVLSGSLLGGCRHIWGTHEKQ